MPREKIVAMVMAGGEGSRLQPLTSERSKPAVPFGGRYRIVDFVLSNLINSGIHAVYLLVQYKSQSLIEHIARAWVVSSTIPEQFITVVPPQMREGPEWFQGTADAVYQNLNLMEYHDPTLVLVFGADHIYRMDICEMIAFHRNSGAQVTVAALPVPREQSTSFGVIAADADGRVRGFQEKPQNPVVMPGRESHVFASMGNYIFNADVLVKSVLEAKERGHSDFGHHVLPHLVDTHKVFAYDFSSNHVPGVRDYEEQAYWRDVGTIDAYFDANQDVLGGEPRLNLFNPKWIVRSSGYQGPPAKIVDGTIRNSMLGAGTLIKGASITNSILRREILLEQDVEIEDCIIMDYVIIRRGAKLKRVIIDRYNNIEPNARIGFDRDADSRNYFVTPSGISVLAKGAYTPEFTRYQ